MHNLKPKKYLGQHFLNDQEIARRITESLQAQASDRVVEIGPGEGVLTGLLLDKYPELKVVEVDREAVALLQQKYADTQLQIIHQDVLKWNPAEHLPEDSFFIGNLPYNISSPFFFLLLDHSPQIQEGVFMVQKEVAKRICEDEASKTYGILGVLLGAYFKREYLFSVPPGAFRPPPKVMSGVMRLRKKEVLPEVPFARLKTVVKTAFQQRRKTLRNALKSLSFESFPEQEKWMTLRAEQLPIESFLLLAEKLR